MKRREEREKKRAEKQLKNKKEKSVKKQGKRPQKKKQRESSDSEEEDRSHMEIMYDDSSDYELNENVDTTKCPKCGDGDLLDSTNRHNDWM